MSGFGNYARRAKEIEREIFLRGLALGVDWDDPIRLRALARHALSCKPGCVDSLFRSALSEDKLTAELFARFDESARLEQVVRDQLARLDV